MEGWKGADYPKDKAGKASLFAQGKRRYDRYVLLNLLTTTPTQKEMRPIASRLKCSIDGADIISRIQ